jgi:5-formyltetrahydrofolate cyclo-ligase
MGTGPGRILVRFIWFPPDVLGVRGYSGKRPRWVRQPCAAVCFSVSDKHHLRQSLRAIRKAYVQSRKNNRLEWMPSELLGLIAGARVIATYSPTRFECDINELLWHSLPKGASLCLPVAARKEDRLIFRPWRPGDRLEPSGLGFLQPPPETIPAKPDLIFTPLLGFDRNMARLGQGAAHYDRAFEDFPNAIRVGLAWGCQEVPALPLDPWDAPLHAILTERDWIIEKPVLVEELRHDGR